MSGRTIGVTVPIPEPYGSRLDVVRAQFGPDADTMSAHVTILPPVDVDDDVVPAILDHLAVVAAQTRPFRLELAGAGTFRPVSPVVFVVVEAGACECTDLERRVRSGVLGVDTRFPFHPHVTIAHDVDDVALDRARRELADFRAEVDVAGMALHEYRDGRWRLVRDFPFTAVPA